MDLIWLLPHSQNDEKAWTAKTLRSRAAYLCVGALRVAADAHGVEEPSLSSLEKAVPDLFAQQCRQSDARECELYVRQHIGWRILAPTPLHFLRIYVSKRPLYPESTDVLADHHRNQPVNDEVRVERLFLYVQKWCCFFCSMCLQHREFSGDKVASAKLAAAVLLVARRNLKLTPAWRPELEAMTAFSLQDVAPVVEIASGASPSHVSATTRPSWLGRAVRNRHRHAIEQASRRWRGGRRDERAVKFDFHTG